MTEDYHPSADLDFIIELLQNSDRVLGVETSENLVTYFIKGDKPLFSRTIHIHFTADRKIAFEMACGIAFKISKHDELMAWFEKVKNWKEGEYFVSNER